MFRCTRDPPHQHQPGFSVLRQLCRIQTRWSHRKIIATSRQVFISEFFMFEFKNYILFRNLKLYSREITKPAAATQGMHAPFLFPDIEQICSVCLFLCLFSFFFLFSLLIKIQIFSTPYSYNWFYIPGILQKET